MTVNPFSYSGPEQNQSNNATMMTMMGDLHKAPVFSNFWYNYHRFGPQQPYRPPPIMKQQNNQRRKAAAAAAPAPPTTQYPQEERKQVHFAPMAQLIVIREALSTIIENDQHNDKWYTCSELDQFRDEARHACQQLKVQIAAANTPATTKNTNDSVFRRIEENDTADKGNATMTVTMAQDSETRGLESRLCIERARRRILTKRCVVRAQTKLDPDRLAALALRCSHWATELAREEAVRDHQRAYDKDSQTETTSVKKTCMASVVANQDVFPKRAVYINTRPESSRRVRPRLS